MKDFMQQCTEEVNQDVMSASVQGVVVQKDTQPAWVTTVHINT